MKKIIFFILLIIFSGCASKNLIDKNENAVNELIEQYPQIKNHTLVVTTITNIDNLNQSSKIGRVITEQIINDLIKNKVKVVEIRMRKGDIIKVLPKKGEFILTRNALELAKIKNANAVLVGTYAIYSNKLYVSIRLIDPATNVILASSDYIKDLK